MIKLNQQLEKENEDAKKRKLDQDKQQASMRSQMNRYMQKYKR
jgi:hypothetical protein